MLVVEHGIGTLSLPQTFRVENKYISKCRAQVALWSNIMSMYFLYLVSDALKDAHVGQEHSGNMMHVSTVQGAVTVGGHELIGKIVFISLDVLCGRKYIQHVFLGLKDVQNVTYK